MKLSGFSFLIVILTVLTLIFSMPAVAHFKIKSPTLSVYQFTVPVGNRKAYLWIPENCRYVRGLIISLENSLERNWLEDPYVRETAAKEDLGIIWLADGKPTNITWEMKPDAVAALQQMFADLALESGYSEIENTPLVVTGHSWNGRIAWTYPDADPQRVIAAVPIRTYPMPDTLQFSGIPICYIVGETTELPQFNDGRPGDRDFFWPVVRRTALALRKNNENNLIGVVTDPGGDHTDWSDHQGKFLALFIRKACHYRIPDEKPVNGKVNLKPGEKEAGWLTDSGGMEPDHFQPAPYKKYKGDPGQAYWFFDEETALAAVAFCGDRKMRQKQMPTFVQDGKLLPVDKSGYVQLNFQPESDGLTFHLEGGFLNEVPAGLIDAGTRLEHGLSHFSFRVTHGPVIQTCKRSFQIQFDRQAFRKPLIQITEPGNDIFRRALQPGVLNMQPKITEGKSQVITFPETGNVKEGTKSLELKATSDSGLPVSYYVSSGPAYVKENRLIFTKIPPKSKFPVKVNLTAWQYGLSGDNKIQSAESVEHSFLIEQK